MLSRLAIHLLALAASASASFDLYPSGPGYPYAVHAPPSSSNGQALCTILFTHGSGSRANSLDEGTYKWDGTGMLVSKYDGGSKYGAYQAVAENYLVVLPVMDTSVRQWDPAKLMQVLNAVKSKYSVDESCIHTQGYSMGGKVTWFMAATYSSTFSSIATSAGFNEFSDQQSTVSNSQMSTIVNSGIGIKAFYGQWDEKQPLSTAQPLFSMLSGLGDSAASLVQVSGADHGAMSSEPWEQTSLWDWVKTQRKGSSSSSSTSPSTTSPSSASSTAVTKSQAILNNQPTSNPKKTGKKCRSSSKRHRRRDGQVVRRGVHEAGPARLDSV